MKKTTMRLFALAMLMMFSIGAEAKIDVQIANDGKFDGGTIEVTNQKDLTDGVEVTITVTPNGGYTINKSAITVVSTYPPSGNSNTRTPEIADNLTLYYNGSEKDDIKDLSAKRDYTFIVPSGFGAWVKEAKFSPKGRKGPGDEESVDFGRSGTYYIGTIGYNASTPAKNFYLCPTEGWCYYEATDDFTGTDNGMPFITTYNCKTNGYHSDNSSDAVWYVEKHPTQNYYYIKQASTGRYLTSNGEIRTTGNPDRMRVHLESVAPENLDDKELFTIAEYSTYLTISPKGVVGGAADRNWLTVNGGNKLALTGQSGKTGGPTGYANTAGIIGVYTQNDTNAPFYLENAISITPPIITNHFTDENTFTITAADDATIYYTTDGTTPTTSTTTTGTTSVNIPQTEGMTVIKALAKATNDNFPTPVVTYVLPICERPTITVSGGTVTITCPTAGATVHYTTNGDPATSTSMTYAGPFAKGDATTIRAIATKAGYVNSSEAAILPPTEVSSSDEMTDMSGNYILASNFTSASSIGTLENPFSGTIDGNMVTLSGLSHPLVAYANGATVKNVMLKDVQISGSGSVGAIAGEASGYTRIYNCGILPSSNKYENESSYVSSSDGYCGGLVGWLKDDSRVINCFSYANITGGTTVAGIVGYNDFASTAKETGGKYTELKTAIVNCMFYGNITSGTTRYPVYGGEKILNNTATGINNYDFYRAEANLGLADNSHYNCSWPAKEEYLTKYEYYRYLLNSNRELCGWWVGAPSAPSGMLIADVQAVAKDASLMAKWVLDPSIAPYPILKAPGKYYSAINQDPDNRINPSSKTWESRSTSSNTITTKAAPDTEGQKLGSITVTINKGGSLSGSSSKDITITAMDIDNNDFCYGKIQLPYYNSIFGDPNSNDWATRYGGNYGDKVVVGWEITKIIGGVTGITNNEDKGHKFTEHWQDGYNFADRYCTTKDENRTFAQGGYYYVPNGVTEITITAKWADAIYLDNSANNSYDRVYMSNANAGTDFAPAGHRPTTLGNGKTVQTGTIANIIPTGDVYEKAIVLVGNHQYRVGGADIGNANKGCTIISADFNLDDEPDYCLIWQLGQGTNRQGICPIRLDFLPVIEMGMAMKEDASTQYYSLGCYLPLGHFEVTETSLIHFGQFEFGKLNRTKDAPLILNGGIYDQYCKGTKAQTNAEDHIDYVILGGNVYMPSFSPGAHVNSGAKYPTRHCAVNVLGGRINNLYLTGNFNNGVTPNKDNPHCYIDGGNFKQIAAAAKEGIDGDVYFKINHSVIEEFYGGSTLADKLVTGNINVTVDNSKVTKYCGGPKFGNMTLDANNPANNKTVTTNATGTTFGVYYGGGNGGTSYVQYASTDYTNPNATGNYDWDASDRGNLGGYTPNTYRSGGKNYIADYEMEIVNSSTGTDAKKGIFRTYLYAAQFSATNTGPITNNLTDCKVLTSFYGGGNLGGVIGDVESTLTDTEVMGSAFGAGYSASVPEVTIYNKDKTAPTLNVYTGIITPTPDPDPRSTSTTYTWCYKNKTTNEVIPSGVVIPAGVNTGNPTFEYGGKKYFYTEEKLENLGTVTGKATLTINGTTTVGRSVYGGGEESGVAGNTEVNVTRGTIGAQGQGGVEYGNVYGGGKGKIGDKVAGYVKGNTTVNISQASAEAPTTIYHNVYGGGAYGSVGDFTYDASTGMPTACSENTGSCTVNIQSGTFGWDGKENGMVFGSSRGDVATPEGTPAVDPNDRMAWVYSTQVNIGTENATTGPHIKGSVYGSGENGHTFQNTELNIYSGTIGIPTGSPITDNNGTPEDTSDDKSYSGASYPYRGNVYGGGCGTDKYDSDGDKKEDSYNPLAGIVRGTTTINIKGGHVVRNVYGAGAMGSVGGGTTDEAGKTTINVKGGRIGYDGNCDNDGCIFGAARGEYGVSTAASGLANVRETEVNISYPTTPTKDKDDKTEQLIAGSVFGGGEAGTVKGSVSVNMTGGLILKDLYGGGALADTQTSNWDASANEGDGDWTSGKSSTSATTTVRLTGGRVGEEVFGGGLGEAGKPAYVWGDVLVELNNGVANNARGCAVGQVFGCNNVNGTPKGDVMVHVYATQNAAATQIANAGEVTNAKVKGRYDVTAVYGGGNQAAYDPVSPYTTSNTSGAKTQVIIEGCSLTSIETVYGGGNAAAVPETNVEVRSAYEIGYLFGGGNGKDDIAPGVENPGADVGTLDHGTTTYGTGNANTLMEGGLIHEAYGGSNQKGIIKGSINQITNPGDPEDPDCCELAVEKIVGAGKYADIDGDVNMTLSCQPNKKVNQLFAGADEANVNGNITLNITNGHFGDVFGGNNLGGAVKGKITVNVEETECQPIKIDNLYLGGNKAAYSIFGYYESDEIHKETGKKILKPRESANDSHTPVDNPATDATHTFPYAQPELNIISCTYIGNVFGGGLGKEAKMYANPTVNVNMVAGAHAATAVPAMMEELHLDVTKTAANPDKLGIIRNVFGGGDAADIAGSTTVNIATEEGKSAYIIGSVFGGGNAADVLGNTNVTMSDGYVFNGIFGGGYAGSVGTFTRSTAAADVNIYGHTTHDGCIGKPVSCAENTGKCTVVVDGGQIGPISVATEGMNRSKEDGGPVPEGWVWGAGQGLVEDPATHPDTHFTSYVGETDVTIKGDALIMESIIGGGEFGRVLGNTLVKVEGGQIGIGAGKVDGDNKPIRYTDDQFVNPLTTTITDANALTECSHYPYGKVVEGKKEYLPYDPYYEDYPTYVAAHPEYGPASTSNPSDGKTWIGCVFGGGSGYMPYKNASGYEWVRSAGWVEGNSEVRISGGHILTNVYGGNEVTDVKGKSIVKMTGGTIGVPRTLEQIAEHPLSCYLFGAGKGDDRSHFYNYTNVGSVEVEVSGGIIYGSVFGGSEDGHVTGDIKVDIKPGAIIGTWGTSYVDGNVFGAGRGFSGNTLTGGNVGGNVTLNISGGDILGSVYGGGRLASVGTYLVPSTDDNYGKMIPDDGNDKHGHITVNISGGTIGNNKEYIYNPTTDQKNTIPNTTFDYQNHLQYTKGGNVFTAGMGRLYALDNTTVLPLWQKLGQCKSSTLNMTGGTVKSSVYGGGEIGIVAQNATVNIDGGTVGTKVVDSNDATKYYYFGSVFGGGKGSTDNIDGISAAGTTQGDVEVHLNKTVASDNTKKGAIVHQVFGCNDMNGSPKGDVTVHVYATQNADKDNIGTKPTKGTGTFDVEAVYGGGNLAAYEPEGDKNTTKSTKVIIDGCELTSIQTVYGGGNAASTPATNVTVNSAYEILELFGGGNGLDKLPDGRPNPGANVGYKNYTVYEKVNDEWVANDDPDYDTKEERTAGTSAITYGTGKASVTIYGGTVHRVFGGSNTKGNVRQTAVTMLDEAGGCEFCVDEAYGGGKSAEMDAEAQLLMACIPGLESVYGGAEAADVRGNVTLNITNGTFDRVFGGNNLSGTISGSITVNVEEIGCKPVKIGELYGGGNQAAYSVYGYDNDGKPIESGTKTLYADPQVNVMSFTSIGNIYGGGYGDGATMVGNPTVNINEAYGKWYNNTSDKTSSVVGENAETPNHYPIPSHAAGKMGAINNVFGGGNAAKVIGNATVNIGTLEEVYVVKKVTEGDPVSGLYTRSGAGTTASPFVYTATAATDTAVDGTTYYEKKDVIGADIRGNVYGGGNNAEVTGNTNVVIGKRSE